MADKLIELTPEHEKLIEETKNKWINFILHSGDEINEEEAVKGAKWLYEFCGFKEPQVHIADSPLDCQKIANKIAGTKNQYYNYSYESLGQSAGWAAYVEVFTKLEEDGKPIVQDANFDKYKAFLESGNFMSIYLEGHAIISRRPKHVRFNERNQLHSSDSAAIEYRDGYKLYFLNGVPVTEELVMTPSEQLDPNLVVKEKNAEIRRELVRKIGVERIYQKLGGNTLDEWKEYKLITLTIPNMRTLPKYLLMRNPSIGTFHMEGVEPSIKTVREALAWRDGDVNGYIEPEVLT